MGRGDLGRGSGKKDHLPAEATSLVGRRSETAGVKQLLTRARLVTLTGPGGVGKTRLALHVARTLRAAFRDGACMVPLAELSQPDLLASTVLTRLDPSWNSAGDVDDLVARIGTSQALLVLDNCEHLTEAVALLVTRLLSGCQHLRVLATSREALRIDGEALYRVPPLALPAAGSPIAPGAAASYDGVALFLERAGALNAEVAAGRVSEAMVVELCRRLDGLPLAIELAAAGSRWQSVESMLAQPVPDPPAPRSAARRHTSVRTSLDYSHDLCSPAARVLWARFSVFRGGATLDAVRAVCAGPGLAADDVAAALFELVEKSVVVLDGSRYTVLETIRQYGARRLAETGREQGAADGGVDAVRLAHLDYFADLTEQVHRGWFGPRQRDLCAQVLADQANVRAALDFSLRDEETARVGLGMAADLFPFWIGTGSPGEGRRWLSQLLAVDDRLTPERAQALWTHGFLSTVDDNIAAARELLAECESVAAGLGDAARGAHALWATGVADLFEGRVDAAIERLEAGIAEERGFTDSAPYLADALINLGLAYCYRGDLGFAREVLTEASELCAAHDEELLLSWALVVRALEALLSGRPDEAARLARDGLRRKRELANLQGVVWAVELLAWAAVEAGDARQGVLLLEAAQARAEDFGPAYHGFPGVREWHEQYSVRARAQLGAEHRAVAARGRELSLTDLVTTALGGADDSDGRGTPRTTASPAAPGAFGPPGNISAPEIPGTPGALAADSVLHDLPLTSRERQIAELVATGKTNREIAADLVIAQRTVDSHVQRILTKLDFTSRSQIIALVAGSARSTR
ncbi:helix-turn-helix transcriptional regulator [Parafrankia sp. FMc2]|uniref:helix-turn-helix transcriptional regulator n=1 Tax=Parafrankia sp. FMc2 TaxID=3233196 RepID=UPI0034D5C5CE